MLALMERWSHSGTSLCFMAVIIFMFYDIYCLHACFICIYFANICAPNIVLNVLSDNKNCCYKNNCCYKIVELSLSSYKLCGHQQRG